MKMPDNIPSHFFAPCGINCKVCYVHLKEKKPCKGCLGEDDSKPEHCRNCKIKNCAREKSITYCYQCSDFPCKQIKNLEKSYNKRYETSLVDNSKIVAQQGIENFMTIETKKWKCNYCGGIISLHDKICSECKQKY